MVDLSNCPFCGAAPVIEDMAGWEIHCSNDACGVGMVLLKPDRVPLIEAWNRRPAAATAPQQSAQDKPAAIREGWKLVPIEPTEEMDAAARAECHRMAGCLDPVIHIWDVMLAAAPAPDTGGADGKG